MLDPYYASQEVRGVILDVTGQQVEGILEHQPILPGTVVVSILDSNDQLMTLIVFDTSGHVDVVDRRDQSYAGVLFTGYLHHTTGQLTLNVIGAPAPFKATAAYEYEYTAPPSAGQAPAVLADLVEELPTPDITIG